MAGDGVTTPDLTLKPTPGVFAGFSVDVRSARKSAPEAGEAASAAKNLDEYQFLICALVPSLPDSSPAKMELQKYRVAAFAAFAKLVEVLNSTPQDLGTWSRHAKWLVEETSEAYLQAKSGVKTHPLRRNEVFDYFGVPSNVVESALKSFYGQQ